MLKTKQTLVFFETDVDYIHKLPALAKTAEHLGYHTVMVSAVPLPEMDCELTLCIKHDDFSCAGIEALLIALEADDQREIVGINSPLGFFDADSSSLICANVAAVATARHLPANGVDALHASHNKWLMRKRLGEAGIENHAFAKIGSEADIEAAIKQVGLPAVLKPIAGIASGFVSVCHDVASLKAAYNHYLHSHTDAYNELGFKCDYRNHSFDNSCEMLLEPYLTGKELSVECLCDDGKVIPLMVHEKFDVIEESHCIYENIVVTPAVTMTAAQVDTLKTHACNAIAALGLKSCICHVELRMDQGKARIIEINPRMGGSHIKSNLKTVYGLCSSELFVRQTLGQPQTGLNTETQTKKETESVDGFLVFSVIYPRERGWLRDVRGMDAFAALPQVRDIECHYPLDSFINGTNEEVFLIDTWYHANNLAEIKQLDRQFRAFIDIDIDLEPRQQ